MKFKTTVYELPREARPNKWSMLHCRQILHEDVGVSLPYHSDFLGIYFHLSDECEYTIDNLQTGTIKGLHYAMVFLPKGSCELILPAGVYKSFCLRVAPSVLKRFADDAPMLNKILNSIERNEPFSLSKQPLLATPEMITIIHDIIDDAYRRDWKLKNMYVEAKFYDLFMSCLLNIHQQFGERLKITDIEKIKKAYTYLVNHVDRSFTVASLSDIVFMDKRKLSDGFKLVFGKTLNQLHKNVRMEKAVALLRDTNMQCQEIASNIGYKKLNSFEKAFKKKFGDDPDTYRTLSEH